MLAVALSNDPSPMFVGLLLLSGLLAIEAGVLPASAQPSSAVGGGSTTRDTVPRTAEQKSVGRAVTYSLGGTLGPILIRSVSDAPPADMLLVAGLLVEPSIGHFYAQKEGRALVNILTRGAIAGASLLSFIATLNPLSLVLGSLLFAGHAVYDIATKPPSVREHNCRRLNLRSSRSPFLWLAPQVTQDRTCPLSTGYVTSVGCTRRIYENEA